HPRVRGDDSGGVAQLDDYEGTPPRARGRRARPGRWLRGGWNTPACAGTTREDLAAADEWTEHPRVRGDDCRWSSPPPTGHGTPPRARGRPRLRRGRLGGSPEHPRVRGDDVYLADQALHYGCLWGNTPACAGTTHPAQ